MYRPKISPILLLVLLVGCGFLPAPFANPSPTITPTLPTTTPTTPSVLPNSYPDLDIISTDNIERLELIERWGKGFVSDMDFSQDGKNLAIATSTGVYLRDNETLEETALTDPGIAISKDSTRTAGAVAFSSDGKYLAIAYDWITIWNLSENRLESEFKNVMSDYRITRLAFSQDNRQIVTMGSGSYGPCDAWGGAFQIYDVELGKMLYYRYFCPESAIFYFRTTTNGQIFLTGISPETHGYETTVVEASTGTVLKTITSELSGVIYDVSADGSLVAVGDYRDNMQYSDLIDIETLRVTQSIEGDAAFLPASDYLLVKDDKEMANWKLKDYEGTTLCTFADADEQLSLSIEVYQSTFKIRGNYLAIWSHWRQEIQVWDTSSCRLVNQLLFPFAESQPVFSPDGTTLATRSTYYVHLWDTATGHVRHSLSGSEKIGPVNAFAFNPDGTQLVAGTRDNPYVLKFMDTQTGIVFRVQESSRDYLDNIAISPDGKVMATLEWGDIGLWNMSQGEVYHTLHQLFISTVSFSPDSTELAAVLHHRPKDNVVFDKIIFLDVKSGQTLREPELHGYWDVTFSPNWKFFAASNSDGYIHLWDLKDKTILHKLIGHHRLVDEHSFLNDIASSPDETLLVSVEGNRVRFWDTQTGKLVGEIVPPFSVFCITFSPDGRLIATTGNDGTVRIWGVQP